MAGKPPKPEIYEVDGHRIEVIRVPVDTHISFQGPEHPQPSMRSKFEVQVDGVLRGWIVYPSGVNNGWRGISLEEQDRRYHGNSWTGVQGTHKNLSRMRDTEGWTDHMDGSFHSSRFESREEAARYFPIWIKHGHAPTQEEATAKAAKLKREEHERKQRDAREKAAREARWAREDLERKRQEQAAQDAWDEMMEGLQALRDRSTSGQIVLTNLEGAALEAALKLGRRATH